MGNSLAYSDVTAGFYDTEIIRNKETEVLAKEKREARIGWTYNLKMV
jgi:hypothetical protein